ncbi:MAG: hypothetical protein HYZ53_24525 [Planctomycetes bacterium]|nr:hypothetical protein [Planctomycetota bacterium]
MPTAELSPRAGPRNFSEREHAILRALAGAVLPGGIGGTPAGDRLDLRDGCEQPFRQADPLLAVAFRALVWGLELAPLFLSRRHRRFTRLEPDDRARWVDAWVGTRFYPVQLAFLGLKSLIAMAYCSHPEYAASIGYSTECLHEAREVGTPPMAAAGRNQSPLTKDQVPMTNDQSMTKPE